MYDAKQLWKAGKLNFHYLVSPQTTQKRLPRRFRDPPMLLPPAPVIEGVRSPPSLSPGRLSHPIIPTSDPPPTEIEQSMSPVSVKISKN